MCLTALELHVLAKYNILLFGQAGTEWFLERRLYAINFYLHNEVLL